jgi:hypothetical protein
VESLPAAILEALSLHPAGMTDGEIARRFGKNHSQVHQTCERLAGQGLIVRDRAQRPIRNRSVAEGASIRSGPIAEIRSDALDIGASFEHYIAKRSAEARYSSFDYCFNYFQSFREQGQVPELASAANRELSALQLAFYLASWGMLRGSSGLLNRSSLYYLRVIDVIVEAPPALWDLDVEGYDADKIDLLYSTREQLRGAIVEAESAVLATKIMLGVFGCVPAFDQYFKKGFGVSAFGRQALQKVKRFYDENTSEIESYRVATLSFDTGCPTDRRYTQAKVIDMIFFSEGASRSVT